METDNLASQDHNAQFFFSLLKILENYNRGANSFLVSNMSIIRPYCLFCNKDSKLPKSSPRSTLRALSCALLVILFDVVKQNIQARGQWLN